MTIDSGIPLKSYAKILHHNFTPTIYENLKSVFEIIQGKKKKKMEIRMPVLFELLNESKQFWGTFFGQCFNKWKLSQKYKKNCM